MTSGGPPVLSYADPAGVAIDAERQFELTGRSPVGQVMLLMVGIALSGGAIVLIAVLVFAISQNHSVAKMLIALGGAAILVLILYRLLRELLRVLRFGYRKIVVAETATEIVITDPCQWDRPHSWLKNNIQDFRLAEDGWSPTLRRLYLLSIRADVGATGIVRFVSEGKQQIEDLRDWIEAVRPRPG